MMSIREVPSVGEALRSFRARLRHGRAVAVVVTFLLATALTLIGTPAALSPVVSCGGQVPGVCPYTH